MDINDILTIIGSYAFPIDMCILLFKKLDSDQQKSMDQMDRRDTLHREEIQSLRSALDNNTAAINALAAQITRNND